MALLLFLIPALWLGYLLGVLVQKALVTVLYYGLGTVTPWLLDHWGGVMWMGLALALVGNAMMTKYIRWGKWDRVMWGLPLVVGGSTLWLTACVLRPDWVLMPLQGLGIFSVLVAGLLARIMAHYAMLADELVKVVGWVLMFIGAIAVLHGAMSWGGLL